MPSLRSIAATTSTLRNTALLATAFATAIVLSGCGVGALDTSTAPAVNVAFGGIVHGGPNPVVGATVKLYATGSSNPGTTPDNYGIGQLLAEANSQGAGLGDTDANGDFSFSSASYTCPAHQFAYLVASGGNPGAGTNNTAVLVAALGRCEDLTPSTEVSISELSTIAAGYALGHFTTITGSVAGGDLNVGIGAPDTENSQTYTVGGLSAGCVANSFYTGCTATVTAGLYHAFLNAANLMTTTGGYQPNANTVLPNPGTTVAPPVPPFALMNTLGNTLVACVNSTGALTTGSPAANTACGDLFAATTPPGGSAPTNTFQSMINLAANPTLAGTNDPATSAPYTPAELIALASPVAIAYSPTVTDTPSDFSMAILYPAGLGADASVPFQGVKYSYSAAVDINDVVYFGNQDSGSATKANVIAFSSNGTLLGYTPDNTATAFKHAWGTSVDALGNVYTASEASELGHYSSANGVLTTDSQIGAPTGSQGKMYYTAVDQANNVWYVSSESGSTFSAAPNVYEAGPGGTSPVIVLATGATGANGGGASSASYPQGIAIDPNQNIWLTDYVSGGAGQVTIIPNGGTAGAPTYNYSGSGSDQPFTVNLPSTVEGSYGIAIGGTSSTNWSAFVTSSGQGYAGILPVAPMLAGAAVTGATPGTLLPDTYNGSSDELWYVVADGDGNVYANDDDGHDIAVALNGSSALEYLRPCGSSSTSSTSCSTPGSTNKGITIDSTGTIWLPSSTSDEEFEVIGAAAPTWPLLSLGITGRP